MKLGVVINETWSFFHEIYEDFSKHHDVSLYEIPQIRPPIFKERINKYLFNRSLRTFMESHDVVFFEWASELLVAASLLPKSCGVVTRLHRYELYQWADKINWDVVDKVILVSHSKNEEFSARFPEQRDKVIVIPEAVSLDKFQPKNKTFTGDIGILCHLSPRKRVYELILAFYELSKEREDLHLHVGGGPRPLFSDYYVVLRDLVRRLQLGERVSFYDNVTDPHEWFRKIDVFISNSYSEGLQVSPMEAMASGCFCLSHWWAGAEELLPEENLFFTDHEFLEKLRDYMGISDDEKADKVARLRERVRERFDIHQIKTQIRHLVEEVGATRVST